VDGVGLVNGAAIDPFVEIAVCPDEEMTGHILINRQNRVIVLGLGGFYSYATPSGNIGILIIQLRNT
jgi:hypothetical protein